MPEVVRDEMTFHLAADIGEVLAVALADGDAVDTAGTAPDGSLAAA